METVENSAKELRRVSHSSHSPYCQIEKGAKQKKQRLAKRLEQIPMDKTVSEA
jgi:uncharacterized phage-associated protein